MTKLLVISTIIAFIPALVFMLDRQPQPWVDEEYVEYESPAWLNAWWGDDEKIKGREKPCTVCRMEDLPTYSVLIQFDAPRRKRACKYCIEQSYLRKHLQSHGTRRHRRTA